MVPESHAHRTASEYHCPSAASGTGRAWERESSASSHDDACAIRALATPFPTTVPEHYYRIMPAAAS